MKDVTLGQKVEKLTPAQLRELKDFGSRIERFGVNFAVFDSDSELVLLCESGRFKSSLDKLAEYSRQALGESDRGGAAGDADVNVWRFSDSSLVLAVVLRTEKAGPAGAALIDLGDRSGGPGRLTPHGPDAAARSGDDEHLAEALRMLAGNIRVLDESERQLEMMGTELSQTYEELVLLHKLSTNMSVTEQDASFLQMACDSLTEIVLVEGIAVLLEKVIDDEPRLVLAAGSGLIDVDERMAATLQCRLIEELDSGKEALLDSEVDSPFRYEWPASVRNIIAVPLCGKEKPEVQTGNRTRHGIDKRGLYRALARPLRRGY